MSDAYCANTHLAADQHPLLRSRAPSSFPSLEFVDEDHRRCHPSYYIPRVRPTRLQLLFSTGYALVLASIIVAVALRFMPVREQNYHQWLSTKMASADPFDELGLAAGVGPVERSMWGLHEEGGWDRSAYMMEKGLVDLGGAGERYRVHHDDSLQGAVDYFEDLRQFINSMPLAHQPSLLTSLYSHLPPSLIGHLPPLAETMRPERGPPGMINYKTMYQTDKTEPEERSEAAGFRRQWRDLNAVDGWKMVFMNDTQASEWVTSQFKGSAVEQVWADMHRGVIRADFLRYLLILIQGGVYSDVDTRPLRPIEHWGANSVEYLDISLTDGPGYLKTLTAHPALIIGVEIDIDNLDYGWYWPRPVQICQWTLSGAPFHPIYLDTVKRIVNATETVMDSGIGWDQQGIGRNPTTGEEVRKEDIVSVLEWTGPPVFSDSVMQYLRSRYRVSWHRLRGLGHPLRIGEILVLPNTAFSPDIHTAGKSWDVQANVWHKFRGSWKTSVDVF